MFTRITNRMMNDNVIRNLLTNRSKLNDLQEQISSGKKLRLPSDDPSGAMNVLNFNGSISRTERYVKNIDAGISELEVTDKALLNAIEVVHRAKELTVSASNVTNSASELGAINKEVEQLLEQTVGIANTKFGNKFIFGGLVTEDVPYQLGVTGIQYVGTPDDPTGKTHERKVEISESVTTGLNLAGDAVFGVYYTGVPANQKGLFETLTTLTQALQATPPDYDAIRGKLDKLDEDLSTLLNAQAVVGGAMNRLEMTKDKLEENLITFTRFKTNIESIDMAKSISDLKFQETALETSLNVSGRVLQPSLLNFL